MLFYLRHPEAVRGLLLMRVTGGAFAANRLPDNYYGQFIKAAGEGGMAAVCATEQYQERIAGNPSNKDRLMKMDPKKYNTCSFKKSTLFTFINCVADNVFK